ncbi:hypothetical protein ACFE04_008539 [Oxalis oulophora]
MSQDGTVTLYTNNLITKDPSSIKTPPFSIKLTSSQILRGGAIIEIIDAKQAKIAEQAGACAVVVTDKQHNHNGVWRMPDVSLVKEIKRVVSIPVIARARVGHFVEAQILERIGVDFIDESNVLTVADEGNFINKHNFRCPFLCGCENLGEALRRVTEGAAMIVTHGDLTNSGNVAKTVKNVRSVMGDIRVLSNMDEDEIFAFAKKIAAPYDLLMQIKQVGRLPVAQFAGGGIVTPADAALMMQLGCDGVFVGSEVFDSVDPCKRVRAIVQAVRHYNDPHVLVESSCGLEDPMPRASLDEDQIQQFGRSEV